jgi:hypothetical protein
VDHPDAATASRAWRPEEEGDSPPAGPHGVHCRSRSPHPHGAAVRPRAGPVARCSGEDRNGSPRTSCSPSVPGVGIGIPLPRTLNREPRASARAGDRARTDGSTGRGADRRRAECGRRGDRLPGVCRRTRHRAEAGERKGPVRVRIPVARSRRAVPRPHGEEPRRPGERVRKGTSRGRVAEVEPRASSPGVSRAAEARDERGAKRPWEPRPEVRPRPFPHRGSGATAGGPAAWEPGSAQAHPRRAAAAPSGAPSRTRAGSQGPWSVADPRSLSRRAAGSSTPGSGPRSRGPGSPRRSP